MKLDPEDIIKNAYIKEYGKYDYLYYLNEFKQTTDYAIMIKIIIFIYA